VPGLDGGGAMGFNDDRSPSWIPFAWARPEDERGDGHPTGPLIFFGRCRKTWSGIIVSPVNAESRSHLLIQGLASLTKVRDLAPPRRARSDLHRSPVDLSLKTARWGLPCCPGSRCVRAVVTTPEESLGACRSLPQRCQLSLKKRQVSFLIELFEACSTFTRVTARTLAGSLN